MSVLEHTRLDLEALAKALGKGGFSFGKVEKLPLTPGSATPYGLLFDSSFHIPFILDEDFMQKEIVNFHPLRNDMTIYAASYFFTFSEVGSS